MSLALAAGGSSLSYASTTAPPHRHATPSRGLAAVAHPAGGAVPKGFVGASLSFISADVGWVLGSAPCAHSPCTSLLRTTDGGESWQGIPAPRAPISDSSAGDVHTLRFANADDGFAFDPGLWTTTNGGSTWTRLSSVARIKPFDMTSVVALGDGTVYALAAKRTSQDAGPWYLLRATAHSTAFSTVAKLPFGNGLQLIAAGSSVYVAGGKTATNRLESFGSIGHHSVALPEPAGTDGGCSVTASSATALLATCGGSIADGAMGSRAAYGTTDGGRHWTRLPDPGQGDGYEDAGLTETTDGHAVLATLDGGTSGLLTTTNHARSWHLTLSYHASGRSFADLGFETNLIGSVIYDPDIDGLNSTPRPTGILLRTTNGGVTWKRVDY